MNRTDAIIAIDNACESLEHAAKVLAIMGASYSMDERMRTLIAKLETLRVDALQCDLMGED